MTKSLDLLTFSNGILPSEGQFLYCLADHAGLPGLHRELRRANVQWRSLFHGTKEEGALSVAPLLISITPAASAEHRRFIRWLTVRGAYTSTLLLVVSSLPIDAMGERLALRLNAVISDDTAVLLRFYDPRVFEHLVKTLSDVQRKQVLCCGERWWFVDRRGELQETTSKFHLSELLDGPVILNADQEFSLLDASEIDQVIQLIRETVPAELLKLAPSESFDFINRCAKAAKKCRIEATHELALYCVCALSCGEKFYTLPAWEPVFRAVSAGEVRFSTAVQQIETA